MRSTIHAAATVTLLPFIMACQAIDSLTTRPKAEVQSVRLADWDLEALTLLFTVNVENRARVAIPAAGFSFALASRGAPLLSGEVELQDQLPPGTTQIGLPVRVPFQELLAAVEGLRPGTSVPYEATLELGLDVPVLGLVKLPLSATGILPVPATPEVTVDSIRWDAFGLTRIDGVLDLSISNPNDFKLDLATLDYALSLGGRKIAATRISEHSPLSPMGVGRLQIPLTLSPLEVGLTLVELLKGERIGYRLEGVLALDSPFGRFTVPLDNAGEAPLER